MIEFTIRDTETGEVLEGVSIQTNLYQSFLKNDSIILDMISNYSLRQEFKPGDMVVHYTLAGFPDDILLRGLVDWTPVGSSMTVSDVNVQEWVSSGSYKLVRIKEEGV